MKKRFVIFLIALLSVILIGQATLKLCSLPSPITTEYLVDTSVNITDHTEESFVVVDHKMSFQKSSKDYLIEEDHSLTEKKVSMIWQPPKSLILFDYKRIDQVFGQFKF